MSADKIGMPDTCINCGNVHEPGECEGEHSFAAPPGYAALTEDIERRLSEARRQSEADQSHRKNREYVKGFYNGEIAALEWLQMRHARREKVRHNGGANPTGGVE